MLKLHRQYVCIRNLNTQEIQEFKTREEALQPYSDRTKYTHTECGIEWLDNNFETCKDNEIRQGQKLTRLDSFIFDDQGSDRYEVTVFEEWIISNRFENMIID